MDEQKQETKTTILDQMVAQDSLQMMKAALPYVPSQGQKFFSVFAKAMELRNTMHLFSQPQSEMHICGTDKAAENPLEMLQDIRRYCNGPTQERLDSMINAMVMVQLFALSQDMNNT